MNNFILPILEHTVILPGLLLAYLPMKKHLCANKVKLAVIAAITFILCILGGGICFAFNLASLWTIVPVILITSIFYLRTIKISKWKSINIILAICAVFCCINSISRIIGFSLSNESNTIWFSPKAGIIYNILCWIFVAVVAYPATHAVRDLLDYEVIAQTWYVFWILPAVFIFINFFLIPIDQNILYQGRLMQIYIVTTVFLVIILLVFYALFYLMAKSLSKNDILRQENQFLLMQKGQYSALCSAIEETRQARHDMRHHFSALASLAQREKWQELQEYLNDAQENIPSTELNLCENSAVDGVASHYSIKYKENDIPFSVHLDLPYKLPVSEMDMCLVLSNLLENALEASLRTNKVKRYIKVEAYMHSDNMVLLSVENAFNGSIEEKNGIFLSTKHRGNGIGIQSVRRIAEKNNGYSRFIVNDNVFCANIMLRGNSTNN